MGICCIPKKRKYRNFEEKKLFLVTSWSDPHGNRLVHTNKLVHKERDLGKPRKRDQEAKEKRTGDLIEDLNEELKSHNRISHHFGHNHHHHHGHHHHEHHQHNHGTHSGSGNFLTVPHSHHGGGSESHNTLAEIDVGSSLE